MKKLIPLLLLLLLVMCSAGCDLVGLSVTTTTEPPVISSFEADPPTIAAGESSTLEWKVGGATKVSIDPGIGSVALEGSRAVMPSETAVYTLTATNASGTSATATAQVIVTGATPPPASVPVVTSFTASPPNISTGGSATLIWNVSNATSVTIDPGLGAFTASGSTIVVPAATTTYILTAANSAGSATASAQVTVSGALPPAGLPVINYFTASPPVIPGASGSTFMRWNVSDATEVSIAPGIGSVSSSGTMLVTLSSSTDFILTASNAYGVVSRTVSVSVGGSSPTPSLFYDFVDNAMSAAWKNGAFTDLGFGVIQDDGYARSHTNEMLDDGNIYPKILETHPQWVSNGSIQGTYPMMTVPGGTKFVAKVGFFNGASGSDGVLFRLTWRELGSPVTVSLGGKSVTYGGALDSFEVDLSPYAGKTGQFGLKVEAGPSSGQDWAAWAEARIVYY